MARRAGALAGARPAAAVGLAAAVLGAAGPPAAAQTRPPAQAAAPAASASSGAADEGAVAEELVVRPRRPQPGAVLGDIKPELQMRPAEIQSYGVSTVTDLLDELAPELQSDRGRDGGSPVVLLDGRRISGFAEIQNVPTEAILRIDILPEEAALKYGYAAEQRVVNVVLRPFFRALAAEGAAGGPTRGGQFQGRGELDLMRIRDGRRLNLDLKVQGSTAITEDERHLDGDPLDDAAAPTGGAVGQYRSLRPVARSISANAVYARPIGPVNATFNASLGATGADSLRGLPTVRLNVPAGDPYAPFGEPVQLNRSLTGFGALHQEAQGWTGHLAATLNRDVARWRLTATGAYDHADRITTTDTAPGVSALQARLDAGDPAFDPFGPLDPLIPGLGPQSTARVRTDNAVVHFVGTGPLLPVPAGDVSATFRLGDDQAWYDAGSDRLGETRTQSLARNDASGHLSLDVPLTSSDGRVLGWVGDLSVNANAAFDRLSDRGVLTAVGYGLAWSPVDEVRLIVSHTRDEAAPSFAQLGAPVVVTPGARVFDFATGRTATVDKVTGGVPDLATDHRSVTKIGLTLKPLSGRNLTITANYVYSRIIDPIVTFPAATAQIQAAFADRFRRDAAGDLDEIDYRPVNFASETRSDFRWGVDYSRPLGPQPPARLARRDERRVQGLAGRPTAGVLQLAIYHTIYFEDRMLARPGGPLFDLLDGSPLGAGGGQPRHQVQAQAGLMLHGYGARLSANWRSATAVDGDGAAAGDLAFSGLATVSFRLWADLGQQKHLVSQHPWLSGARVTLAAANLFDRRLQVHDSTGATPLIYQPDYLDPVGRVVTLSMRKLFY